MRHQPKALPFIIVLIFLIVLLRTAWMSDDAYITLRTVDNFIHGYGPTWNVVERVQAFTHPLWMFLLSLFYLFTKEAYFTTILISIALSMSVVAIYATKFAKTSLTAACGTALFVLSSAFVDYSTSGLENPLTHLLVAIFYVVLFFRKESKQKLFLLAFVTALIAITRLDIILIVAPPLTYAFLTNSTITKKERVKIAFIGFLPFILWETFSLLYYGLPFPNTAYAKLSHQIPGDTLLQQGFKYLLTSVAVDPITLTVISLGITAGFGLKGQERLAAIGILLYLLYILKIGGDFMGGRFLTAPFLVSVILVSRIKLENIGQEVIAVITILLIGISTPFSPIFSNYDYPGKNTENKWPRLGVSDERGYYYHVAGLLRIQDAKIMPNYTWSYQGVEARNTQKSLAVKGNIGYYGYFAGPGTYIVDPYALSDPLLSKLPTKNKEDYLTGHFTRVIPCGYIESLRSGTNQICDGSLSQYYEKLRVITQGPLLSADRVKKIIKFNLGGYDYLLDEYLKSSYPDGDGAETRLD